MNKKLLIFVYILLLGYSNAQNSNDQPIDVTVGMTSHGVSESVKMADEALKNNKSLGLQEKLDKSMQRIEERQANSPSFNDIQNERNSTNASQQNISVQQQSLPTEPTGVFEAKDKEGDKFHSEVDLDKYYDRQSDGTYIKKKEFQKSDNSSYTPLLIILGIAGVGLVGFLLGGKNKRNSNESY